MSYNPDEMKENETPSAPNVTEEESTIFGVSPTRTETKPRKKNGRMIKTLLSSFLVLAVLAGAIFAVVKLIPEKEDEEPAGHSKVPLSTVSNSEVETVTITRPTFKSTYRTTVTKAEDDTADATVTWSIDGIDPELTASTSISYLMDTALRMDAMRQMSKEEGADYGFAAPLYKVEAKGYEAADDVTILIGNKTPGGDAYYATTDGGATLYIVEASDVAQLDTTDEDMGNLNALYPVESDSEHANYFESNALATFDSITLVNKKGKTVITPNDNENVGAYMAFIMTEPIRRYADGTEVETLMKIATGGLSATSIYKYNPTAADLKTFGLSSPEFTYSLKYGKVDVTFKATLQPDGYYAVVTGRTDKLIYKVSADAIPFAENESVDFASSMFFVEMLADLKHITFKTADATYRFDVSVTEDEEENEVINISINGKAITTEYFQNYYQHLVGTELNEFAMEKTSGTPVLTVTAEYAANDGVRELKFIKHTDRRYYVESDQTPAGYISSAYMDKLLDYVVLAAENKEVPDPY